MSQITHEIRRSWPTLRTMSSLTRRLGSYSTTWIASLAIPAGAQLILSKWWSTGGVNESPRALFFVVVISAVLCVVTSGVVLARSLRTKEAELAYLGLFFLGVSMLPLVHGLTVPTVLYGDNDASVSSAFWSLPFALAVALPALVGRTRLAARIDAAWTRWVIVSAAIIIALSSSLLIWTSLLPVPDVGSTWTTVVALASFSGCVMLSRRHLELARIARSKAPLIVAGGYGLVGSSALVWIGAAPYSAGFWAAHVLDISGVFLGTIGALHAFGRTGSIRQALAPILIVDPRSALELGLDPSVHQFITELETKDEITRDHVVRTAELAILTGRRLGLDGDQLRQLGLTALLHDIGKLHIPDVVLNKPGELTREEYAIVKRHANYGADIVAASVVLAPIEAGIRSHHERMDGRGYPRGLIGSQIPLDARIVSVCDAFDAIANTRQYRDGVGVERALVVLQQNAGTQWDRRVVDTVVRVVRANPPTASPQRLDAVGRIGCDCLPDERARAA